MYSPYNFLFFVWKKENCTHTEGGLSCSATWLRPVSERTEGLSTWNVLSFHTVSLYRCYLSLPQKLSAVGKSKRGLQTFPRNFKFPNIPSSLNVLLKVSNSERRSRRDLRVSRRRGLDTSPQSPSEGLTLLKRSSLNGLFRKRLSLPRSPC